MFVVNMEKQMAILLSLYDGDGGQEKTMLSITQTEAASAPPIVVLELINFAAGRHGVALV